MESHSLDRLSLCPDPSVEEMGLIAEFILMDFPGFLFWKEVTSRTWHCSAFLSVRFLGQAVNILFGLNSNIQLKRSDQLGPKRVLEK